MGACFEIFTTYEQERSSIFYPWPLWNNEDDEEEEDDTIPPRRCYLDETRPYPYYDKGSVVL